MGKRNRLHILFLALILAFIGLFSNMPEEVSENAGQSWEDAEVVRVIDGDTIEVKLKGAEARVRYIGIDAPESVDPNREAECFGKEASEKNTELVAGKTVTLVKDVSERDKYNRLLRYVYVGDLNVGRELVRLGYAHAATFPPDVLMSEDMVGMQREAQEAKRGLWSGCSS